MSQIVQGYIHMQPFAVYIDHVPSMDVCADSEAWDVHCTAKELEIHSVGPAVGLQLSDVWRKSLGRHSLGPFLIGQQGTEVVMQIFYLFPV